MSYRRPDQCFRCSSRRCRLRIEAPGGFDEVACSSHAKALELHADAVLPKGAPRLHEISSAFLRRAPR